MEASILTAATLDTPQKDDELAVSARKDPYAFGILYQRYVARVYRYLYGKTGCAEDAEDLTAQVFTEVIEALPRYRPQGNFAGWLFTIARRRALNAYRAKPGCLPLEAAENRLVQATDALGQIIRAERIEQLLTMLKSLGEDELELIRLHFYAGLTYAQIGSVLGKREAAVAMAMHRLLRRLEDRWEEDHD